ncbi:MAG: family 10 glycosylhydrolase [Armatimonadetes bacterium]|nr:family 10 glycosylhydrolase [Armatimonadota bacterium]
MATVDNIDWPTRRDLSTDQQKHELMAILDRCQALNLNAVILQVRTSCDALYDSKLEPWSEFLTGQQGRPPSPYWDPLKLAVTEAHKRGLELHAWFNPYRAKHPAMKGALDKSHLANSDPALVKTYGQYLWLDPGEPKVQERSLAVILDVVKRYDVDGVHIDDYFYPYPIRDADGKTIPFPDDPSFQAYQARGGKLNRDDWRRKNVDDFIQAIHKGIKRHKPRVKFGISPFGIYRPNMPEGIKAGLDQYAELYADCLKWLKEGWCDYFTPQLYWRIDPPAQSYPKLLEWWAANNPKKVAIWPGSFTGQIGEKQANWPVDEILRQIEASRAVKGVTGQVHFSMKSLMQNWKGIGDKLVEGPYRQKVRVPGARSK